MYSSPFLFEHGEVDAGVFLEECPCGSDVVGHLLGEGVGSAEFDAFVSDRLQVFDQ